MTTFTLDNARYAKGIMKAHGITKYDLSAKAKVLLFWLMDRPVTNFLKTIYLAYPSDTLKHLRDDHGILWHKKKADGAKWVYFVPNDTADNWGEIRKLFELEIIKSKTKKAA
jgi:hypothetical protein